MKEHSTQSFRLPPIELKNSLTEPGSLRNGGRALVLAPASGLMTVSRAQAILKTATTELAIRAYASVSACNHPIQNAIGLYNLFDNLASSLLRSVIHPPKLSTYA